MTIDTLRADFLGAYGRAEARTPVLDRLAAEGYRFDHVVSPNSLTGPSHLSILTGLTPGSHGILKNGQPAPREVETLAEAAARHGLRTAAFVSGAPLRQRMLRILDRFEHYDDDFRAERSLPEIAYATSLGRLAHRFMARHGIQRLQPERYADQVTDRAIEWLDSLDDRPFFAWVHYFDPHLPYTPPERFLDERSRAFNGPDLSQWYRASGAAREAVYRDPEVAAQMLRLYDAEIAFTDSELGRLLEAARRRAGERLWTVVTADHGSSFGSTTSGTDATSTSRRCTCR